MIAALMVGAAIWTLALTGAVLIAGPVGAVVWLAFFAIAGALGVLSQRDLAAKYDITRKDSR